MSEKARARVEMEQEQSKHDCASEQKWKQRNTASEESKAKEKESNRGRSNVYRESLVENRITLGSLPETLQMTTLLSSPLHLVPNT